MAVKTFPDFSGGGGGGGGGPAEVTFPLVGPAGSAGSETFGFDTGGGIHGTSSGGVVLSVAGLGDVASVDTQGQATFAYALRSVGLATLAGGTSTPTLTAGSVTTTGNAAIGGSLGLAGSAQLTGDLSARSITASQALSAASVSSTGPISGTALSVTGQATIGSLSVNGTFRADQIESDGALLFPTSNSGAPGIALGDQPGTGIFGAPGTLGFAVAGENVLSFAANKTATFAGDAHLGVLTAGRVETSSLSASGAVDVQDLSASSLTVAAASDLQGPVTIGGDLTVAGTSRLSDLRIDELSTDHDLTVGGDSSLAQNLTVAGSTQLHGLAAGVTSLAQLTTSQALVAQLLMLTGSSTNEPVRKVPVPNQPSTTDYAVYLDPGGDLGLSGNLLVFGTSHLKGAATFDGAATAGELHSLGGLTAAGDASITGSLTLGQNLTAPATLIGGSAFSTGSGSPGGQVTGSPGDTYIDRAAGALFIKASGQGTDQGWLPLGTAGGTLQYPLQAPDTAASTGPSYAFATSTGDGLGSEQAGTLYLATSNAEALTIAPDGVVTLANRLVSPTAYLGSANISGLLQGGGDGSFSGDVTATNLYAQGSVGADTASIGNALTAGATTLASLAVTGAATVGANLSVNAEVASNARLIAPKAVLSGATVSSGSGAPNGTVVGNLGDIYLNKAAGELWVKATGTGNTVGWAKVSTSAAGTTFPLVAPDGSATTPSYGFTQGGLGITATGTQLLSGIAGGVVGWTLGGDQKMALAGALQVAGMAQLAAVSASSLATTGNISAGGSGSFGSLASSGALSVTGGTTLDILTAQATNVSSLTASGAISAGTQLSVAGTTLLPGSAKPADNTGQQGDLAPTTSGSVSLYVRGSSVWKAVAFVGDPAPTSFPLRGPADSAAAPNYASSASPGTGMFAKAANQLGFATAGTQAGYIDATGAWFLSGALSAGAATLTAATVNGGLTVTGNGSIGGTLNVTGAVTLASTLSGGDITSSGRLTGQNATINGALTTQNATATGDVTIGGSLTVNGTTTYAGVQRTGYLQTGDGTVSSPAWAFTAEPASGVWRPAANTLALAANSANMLTVAPALATFAGSIRVGGTNAGLGSPGTNQLTLQTAGTAALSIAATGAATFAAQAQVPAGSASGPGLGVGGTTSGLYAGSDAAARAFVGISQAGTAVARFLAGISNSLPVWTLGLGDPASTTVSGGIIASAQLPSAGATTATPSAIYQYLGGGAAQALWVNESTTSTPAFVKVLTTSSPLPPPTYPLVGPAGSASAPTFQVGATHGLYSTGAGTGLAFGGAQAALFSTTLASLPGSLQVGGTNAGIGSNATNQLVLQTAGTTALTVGPTGTATFAFPAQFQAGSIAAPSIAIAAANHGLYYTTVGAQNVPTVGITTVGLAVASFSRYTSSGTGGASTVYQATIGDQASTTTTQAAFSVGTLTPNGNIGGNGGSIYAVANGGQGALWVNEGTASNSNTWNKVLTTASTLTPTFPLQSTSLGSATAPIYAFGGVSGYTSTGVYAASEASSSSPVIAFASNGIGAGYLQGQTVNSLPLYSLFLGPPTAGANAALRASAQSPNGAVGSNQAQLYLNTAGAAGSTLWVHESATANNTWAYALTSGPAQLAVKDGTVAAPYFSFPSSTSTGLTYVNDAAFGNGPAPALVSAGRVIAYGAASVVNSLPVFNLVIGDPTTSAAPYPVAIRASAQTASGNIIGAPGQLAINNNGGPGTVLAVKESGVGSTAGWAFVVTETTNNASARLLQTTAPTAVSGVSRIWSNTNGLVLVTNTQTAAATSPPTLRQEIPATLYSASQTLTQANNNSTIYVTAAQTLTLPSAAAQVDLCFRFQSEAAVALTVKANTGQTIYFGNTQTATAGQVATTAAGSTIELFLRAGGTAWMTRAFAGSWSAT